MNKNISIDDLQPGTWILMQYGFNKELFYVLQICNDQILLGNPEWCASSWIALTIKQINDNRSTIIKRTKKRWWWKFLP